MTDSQLRGAVVPPRPGITPETFDRAHGTTAKNALMWRLARQACGPDYPGELQAWGMTTWWTLGRFVGDLAATRLEPASVDGAVCADAVFFALDRVAVFAEMARILRPGARFVFTADESDDSGHPAAIPDWAPIVEAGGLIVESREEIPHWREDLLAMYDTWMANISELRLSLGDEPASAGHRYETTGC